MKREQFAPPSPEVQHLPTLLRRVQAGEIRVPAFQREYVWTEKQIIELLESIYNGYPIGSLLFWQPTTLSISIKVDTEFPIPQSAEKHPATYILDGQQRLATAYNCFFRKDLSTPDKFNVTFDLRKQSFQHYRRGDSASGRLHLGSLFSPKAFLEVQQALSKENDAESLLDASIALHAAFQDYMIPIVNIKGRETRDVVQVFERINNTGVRLSSVDFMRAVTWSDKFDLTEETSRLRRDAEESGFLLPPETLVKIIAISQNLDPTPDSMLRLREFGAPALHAATELASKALTGAIMFLKEHLHILSYEYVPYEAQMLVISKLYLTSNLKPNQSALKILRQWFLRTSIAEELQGKADSVITHLVNSSAALAKGDARAFEGRIELVPEDLRDRKFIVRRALSSALAIVLADRGARSVVTGEVIPIEDYMCEFASSHYVPILSSNRIKEATGAPDRRLFANMLLVSESDRRTLRSRPGADLFSHRPPTARDSATFESQVLSVEAHRHLMAGRSAEFLRHRSQDILTAIQQFLG
ncbi:DUF262 domain-containing protein [Myxococcaceae bacterium GXIMD 01537]